MQELKPMYNLISKAFWALQKVRGSQSIKIDIGKSFDKSISIDKLILNDIDFISQSIKIDTNTPTKC